MAAIAPEIVVFNDATLKIAAHNYELQISSAKLTPTTPKKKFKGIGGNSINKLGSPDWVAAIGYAQDFETANSLSNYLLDHQGETVAAELYPLDGGTGFAFDLVLEPGGIGGDVDEILTDSVTLEIDGQPAKIVTP